MAVLTKLQLKLQELKLCIGSVLKDVEHPSPQFWQDHGKTMILQKYYKKKIQYNHKNTQNQAYATLTHCFRLMEKSGVDQSLPHTATIMMSHIVVD